jgi:hypothetical protein
LAIPKRKSRRETGGFFILVARPDAKPFRVVPTLRTFAGRRFSFGRPAGRKTVPRRSDASHFSWPMLLFWSPGRTQNRFALLLADAPRLL